LLCASGGCLGVLRSTLRAFDGCFFAYLLLVTILTSLYRESIPAAFDILAKNGVVFLVTLLLIRYGEVSSNPVLRFSRFWYLCAGLPILFTELSYIIHVVRPVDLDPLLAALDVYLFGVHPTLWLERFVHPVLTDILQIFYVVYFFLPLPLGFALYFGKEREQDFYAYTTAVAMLFLVSLLGYLAVPAIGPRYTMASLYQVPLEGRWCADELMALLNRLEGLNRDCFPSGHAAMAVLVCLESYKYRRGFFPLYLFLGTGVFLGTVYLRTHYMVDLPAGILVAVFCSMASRPFVRWWERRIRRTS